jgi:RecQ family ATP-dependent DNA helicase
MLWTEKAKKYLNKYWNITDLKDKQIEVINELLLGNDVIGLLPTGYGKSMCYILPPLITKKIIFIISPLISLMDEQKEKLQSLNILCTALHGNNGNKDQEINEIINGKIKIVYMSPEYLIKGDGLELAKLLISDDKLGFLAVDESHCISVWGQDFRPEYTNINKFRENFPEIPIIAVTATATETVCDDITKLLHLKNPIIVRTSFDRPNLYIDIREIPTIPIIKNKKIKEQQISKEIIVIDYVRKYINNKIIIYTNSRKETEELAYELNKLNPECCQAYHAGLSKKIRENIQKQFTNGEIKVIISTIAFGMGIDQIVKCVLIFGSPSSIEEYYQQIGRGGRDGLPCETVLYFDYSKFKIAQYMLKELNKFPALYKAKKDNLNKIKNLVYIKTCRRKYILEYFNEKCNFINCNNCDNCLKSLEKPLEQKSLDNFDEIISKYEKFL